MPLIWALLLQMAPSFRAVHNIVAAAAAVLDPFFRSS